MQQTLEQLKEQNAAEEAQLAKPVAEEEAPLEPEASLDQPDGESEAAEGEGSEDWLAEEKADDGKSVPLAAHIDLRTKLKGKLKEQNSELEVLRKEVESLKQMKAAPVVTAPAATSTVKLPDPLDFNTTEAYQVAMDKYIADRMDERMNLVSQTNNAKSRQEAETKAREQAVDDHYKRAAKLLQDHSISAELYQQADLTVRQAINSVIPDGGDAITDALIARLGEGSEKVMYVLGRNSSDRDTLISKLTQDPSGISASMFLGELKARKASAKSNSSTQAPAPAARAKGSNKTVGSATEMKRKYDEAHKRGDVSAAFNHKMSAKEAGINVKSW